MSVKEGWIEVGSSFVSFFYRSKGSDSSRCWVVRGDMVVVSLCSHYEVLSRLYEDEVVEV
jgi:hypothetical protein